MTDKTLGALFKMVGEVALEDGLNTEQMFMHISQEVGELAECINVEKGVLLGKTLKENSLHEVADIFIATIATIVRHNKDNEIVVTDLEGLGNYVSRALHYKLEKYKNIVEDQKKLGKGFAAIITEQNSQSGSLRKMFEQKERDNEQE